MNQDEVIKYQNKIDVVISKDVTMGLADKVYSVDEIKHFIEEAVCTKISTGRFRAIELGTKAFWGSDALVKQFQELETIITTVADCDLLKELLEKRQNGEDEMANQVLLWYESLPSAKRSSYGKNWAIWAKICAELNLARGWERFFLYSKYLEG